MVALTIVFNWLVHAAGSGFILLAIGGLAVYCFREPVHRIRLIQWTLLGCLLVPVVGRVPGLPRLCLG